MIGDAPPTKSRRRVKRYRRRDASCNLSTHPYCSQETFYKDETIKLANAGVEIHTYYVANWARKQFEWMATKTGGNCQFLDVNSPAGAQMLTEFLSMRILNSCGGDELVRQCKAKFMHVHLR